MRPLKLSLVSLIIILLALICGVLHEPFHCPCDCNEKSRVQLTQFAAQREGGVCLLVHSHWLSVQGIVMN